MPVHFGATPPVPQGIGPIGNLEGRIVGLHAFGNLAADAGALGAEKAIRKRQKNKAGKDHNDQPVAPTIGSSSDGRPIKDVSWLPAY